MTAPVLAALLLLGASAPIAAEPPPPAVAPEPVVFMTAVTGPADERKAAVLVDSLRAFGGAYARAPIYVAQLDPDDNPCERLAARGVTLVPLRLDGPARSYPYAYKAYAAAEVERLVGGRARSLVWLDPGTLVLAPPAALTLQGGHAAALRPAFLANTVGQPPEAEPDAYWSRIYELTGADWRSAPAVEEYVTGARMRAYWTCILIALDPSRGLYGEWARVLGALLADDGYQQRACADALHRIFLHQAALCGVLAARLRPSEMAPLPPEVGYPFNLQARLPEGRRLARLNDAACAILEDAWDGNPAWMEAIRVDEPLRSWLAEAYRRSLEVTGRILREEGSCNTYLVRAASGSVVIDPGGADSDASWLLRETAVSPVRAVLLTHAHEDHRGGIARFTGGRDVPVVAQREMVELVRSHDRLAGFYRPREARQRGKAAPPPGPPAETPIEATVLFADEHTVTLDDLHIRLVHTGGETPDTSLIWIPELRAAFLGDDFYDSFPNLSPLRGSKPRWALDYLAALELALELRPEVLLPGHGEPVLGEARVRRRLEGYRDAVRHVHDAVVAGMNTGKDVYALMREVSLPEGSEVGEFYGRVSWSVRGIYEGYAGWFDGSPASMYALPPSAVAPDLVALAGGPDPVARRSAELAAAGDDVRALHLTDMVLAAAPGHRAALEARLAALRHLRAASRNFIERNWLASAIGEAEAALAAAPPPA